ncbi:MAG TPA: phosphate ABC transporter substrate-binding protein [Usitatibacter sp.]|jgi:ABC-type phosphate transport system substrate-binding protein|nr:phosphate ABC transporter substrate-binding protein [Usitatibacter sp.]
MTRRLLFQLLAAVAAAGAFSASAEDVVAVVSAKSPVTSLNSAQVADIFLGKTSRFPDGTSAVPIDQVEDSPVRDRFYAEYTGKSPAQVKAHWSKLIFTGRGQPPRQVANSAEAKRAIAEDPHAIGYIDNRLVDASVRVLPPQ